MTRPRLIGVLVLLALLDAAILGTHFAVTRPPAVIGSAPDKAQAAVALLSVLEQRGLSAALDALERAAARDSAVLRDGHQLAHTLGRRALERAQGDAHVLAQCRPIFASGCYHGVVEAALHRSSRIDIAELDRMCSAAGSEENPAPVFECVHGLGHGVLGALGHDLDGTLRYCDALPETRFAASCREGAFMEAINSALAPEHGHAGMEHGRHTIPQGRLSLDPGDPYAPCDRFDDPYAASCWLFQGFVILRYRGFEPAAAFRTCDDAPAARVERCYESVGFQLTGAFQRDDAWIVEQCASGRSELAPRCAAGAAAALSTMDWSGARATGFCAAAPEEWKESCYRSAGSMLAVHVSPARRAEACGRIEQRYAEVCRSGAGLVRAG